VPHWLFSLLLYAGMVLFIFAVILLISCPAVQAGFPALRDHGFLKILLGGFVCFTVWPITRSIVRKHAQEAAIPRLYKAVARGDIGAVKALLEEGCDVDATADRDETALTLAAREGQLEIVRLLIDAGAKVNFENDVTPLHCAAKGGHMEVARALLDSGAAVNAKCSVGDSIGETPYDWAAEKNRAEIMDLLRRYGGHPEKGIQSGDIR
jgi:hypothetical protein